MSTQSPFYLPNTSNYWDKIERIFNMASKLKASWTTKNAFLPLVGLVLIMIKVTARRHLESYLLDFCYSIHKKLSVREY